MQTIDTLKDLETNTFLKSECAQTVQKVCEMFTQKIVTKFLVSSEHPKLDEYILEVLKRVDQLNDKQIIGLMLASFYIGGSCWLGTVKLLTAMDQEHRQSVLKLFQMYLCKQYKDIVADWWCTYWRQIEQQNLEILKYIRTNPTTVDSEVLMLSLAVTVQNHKRFVSFASEFVVTAPISFMVIDTIKTRPSQSKMTYESFADLVSLLQDKTYASTIDAIKDSLTSTQLCRWAKVIE